MIEKIYARIGKAFDLQNYCQVINLIEEALKIPHFGFNLSILYQYGYALLKENRIQEGIKVLEFIAKNDDNPLILKKVSLILEQYKQNGLTNNFMSNLSDGFVVHLKPDNRSDNDPFYLVWKVINNTVYAFPLRQYRNHGKKIYGNNEEFTTSANLVTFNLDSIAKIAFILNKYDYQAVLRDLYERLCVLGVINNTPKNKFVREFAKKIIIEVGSIIAIYDPINRYRCYYYIVEIDEEHSKYKGFAISHNNGEINIKSEDIVEIPFSSYIMEKIPISVENQQKLRDSVRNIENTPLTR